MVFSCHSLFIPKKCYSPEMGELQAFGLHLILVFQGCVLVTFGRCGYLLMANH